MRGIRVNVRSEKWFNETRGRAVTRWYLDYRYRGQRLRYGDHASKAEAQQAASAVLHSIKDGTHPAPAELKGRRAAARAPSSAASPTFRAFAERWLEGRADTQTHAQSCAHLARHVFPRIGDRPMDEIKASDLVDLIRALETTTTQRTPKKPPKPLAKATVRNIFELVRICFADAEQADVIAKNPCRKLRRAQLPKKAHRTEVQKRSLTVEQVSALISHPEIPLDRRTFYALQFFTGTRFSEAAALRWGDIDHSARPLACLHVRQQWDGDRKTFRGLKGKRGAPGPSRTVPVHPVLASILAEWKLGGYPQMFCRTPGDADVIVPTRRDGKTPRNLRRAAKWYVVDAKTAGFEAPEETHVLRRSLISIALAKGAIERWLARATHNSSGSVIDGYASSDWNAMCDAIRCVPVRRLPPATSSNVHELRATGTDFGQTFGQSDENSDAFSNDLRRRGGDSNKAAFRENAEKSEDDAVRGHETAPRFPVIPSDANRPEEFGQKTAQIDRLRETFASLSEAERAELLALLGSGAT